MHRGHRAGQLVHLHHSGSHFRILANETGSRIATPNCFYHSEPRTISLDHLTHGPTRLPSELSEVNGTSSTRIKQHPHIHRWRADPHRHTRETLGGPGAGTPEARSASPENQPGQMSIRQSTSLLPGIYPNSRRNQTRRGQAENKQATPPNDVKGIRSFMGLCNYFRHHIQDFAIIAAPLFKLTRQDSKYQSGPLTGAALTAFQTLQNQLSKQQALAFPRHDWDYLLITNAYLPNRLPWGSLCQLGPTEQSRQDSDHLSRLETVKREREKLHEIPPGDRHRCLGDWQLQRVPQRIEIHTVQRPHHRDHAAAGYHSTENPEQAEKHNDRSRFRNPRQTKRGLARLLEKEVCEGQGDTGQNQAFNKVIHVNLINADTNSNGTSGRTILSITDDTKTFTQVTVIANREIDSTVSTIWQLWCQPYGLPETIVFNQGKVQTSKLESRINSIRPLVQMISCRSQKDTFNQEIQRQWRQNQNLGWGIRTQLELPMQPSRPGQFKDRSRTLQWRPPKPQWRWRLHGDWYWPGRRKTWSAATS